MCFRLFSASKNALGLQNKGKKCFNLGMLNAHGKHPLKSSDPPAPRQTSLKWLTVAMPLLETFERFERDRRETMGSVTLLNNLFVPNKI